MTAAEDAQERPPDAAPGTPRRGRAAVRRHRAAHHAHRARDPAGAGAQRRRAARDHRVRYGLYLGTFDSEPVSLHTGDNPGYRSVLGWFPGGMQIVGLANDDDLDWDRVLAAVL